MESQTPAPLRKQKQEREKLTEEQPKITTEIVTEHKQNWWEEEADKQPEQLESWKPEEGTHRALLLGKPEFKTVDEGAETKRDIAIFPMQELLKDDEGQTVKGDETDWIMNKKYGPKAPYAQIINVIKAHNGIPEKGLVVIVTITGEGKTKQYTVIDPQDI